MSCEVLRSSWYFVNSMLFKNVGHIRLVNKCNVRCLRRVDSSTGCFFVVSEVQQADRFSAVSFGDIFAVASWWCSLLIEVILIAFCLQGTPAIFDVGTPVCMLCDAGDVWRAVLPSQPDATDFPATDSWVTEWVWHCAGELTDARHWWNPLSSCYLLFVCAINM